MIQLIALEVCLAMYLLFVVNTDRIHILATFDIPCDISDKTKHILSLLSSKSKSFDDLF